MLKSIAALPEVRQDKVLQMRQQLTQGVYRDGDHIEAALDRVLEDLMGVVPWGGARKGCFRFLLLEKSTCL